MFLRTEHRSVYGFRSVSQIGRRRYSVPEFIGRIVETGTEVVRDRGSAVEEFRKASFPVVVGVTVEHSLIPLAGFGVLRYPENRSSGERLTGRVGFRKIQRRIPVLQRRSARVRRFVKFVHSAYELSFFQPFPAIRLEIFERTGIVVRIVQYTELLRRTGRIDD